MAYILLQGNVVIQKSNRPTPGFIEVDDSVQPGQVKQGNEYVDPPQRDRTWHEKREAAYKAKGWKSSNDLIDDILDRGIDAVKADRDAIKATHPEV